jgi:hypothetical protein
MRDFTNERLMRLNLEVQTEGKHLSLFQAFPASDSDSLTAEERRAVLRFLVSRSNAVIDALDKLEASRIRPASIGCKWKYPNGPLALEAMEILRNALQGD